VSSADPSERPGSFLQEELAAERFETRRLLIRWCVGFALLFAGVFFAFWWSGKAVRFSASRVMAQSTPTYHVWGVVRDAQTGEPLPWALVEDNPAGNPPYFRAEAGADGTYSLLTLAEPHQLRITASGHRPAMIGVGKPWFSWWPDGEEKREIRLVPE
jgi:hypothetical protein